MGDAPLVIPKFIHQTIEFPEEKTAYELIRPLTDYRKCFDGLPVEARILFICKPTDSTDEYVVKVKVQVPAGNKVSDEETIPEPGPSTTTSAELKALQKFKDTNSPYAPHLVAYRSDVQGSDGPLPGGYITYTIMTKIPGRSTYDLRYWDQTVEEREAILNGFKAALRAIYSLGIEPIDCGMRNVMWEPESKKCAIIDFELWREANEYVSDEIREIQRWGLMRRPAPRDWWAEWNYQFR